MLKSSCTRPTRGLANDPASHRTPSIMETSSALHFDASQRNGGSFDRPTKRSNVCFAVSDYSQTALTHIPIQG